MSDPNSPTWTHPPTYTSPLRPAAEFIKKNLIPATLGNIIGGMALVGAMYSLVYGRPGQAMSTAWDAMVLRVPQLLRTTPSRGGHQN